MILVLFKKDISNLALIIHLCFPTIIDRFSYSKSSIAFRPLFFSLELYLWIVNTYISLCTSLHLHQSLTFRFFIVVSNLSFAIARFEICGIVKE